MSAFNLCEKGTVGYLAAPLLARFDSVTHAFCTRRGGVSKGDFASLNFSDLEGDATDNVKRNRDILYEAFQICPEKFIMMNQVHGDRVMVIGDGMEVHPEGKRECDAMITDRPGVALVVKTADCVPILMLDSKRGVIGAAHAGWRGTAKNVAGKLVNAFVEKFSSRKEDIIAAVGPAIGRCCYQVDAPVYEAFAPYYRNFFAPHKKEGAWMLDLAGINRLQVEAEGVPPENISSADQCTCCLEEIFFSHRRDCGKTGRHANFIMLKQT